VDLLVALRAQRDEIFFRVIALLAPKPGVMDLQSNQRPASLASPTIALEHLLAQFPVCLSI
jgi:hypothetical protein